MDGGEDLRLHVTLFDEVCLPDPHPQLTEAVGGERRDAAGEALGVVEVASSPGLLGAVDLMSSAPWFDGWRDTLVETGLEGIARPVAAARTWLIQVGWRRHGLLAFSEVPGPPPRMPPRQRG